MRLGLSLWGFSVGARVAVDLAVLAEQRGFDSVFMVEGVLSNDAVTTEGMASADVSDRHRNGHRECLPASPRDAGDCRRHRRRPLGRTPRARTGPEQRADDCPRGARVARSRAVPCGRRRRRCARCSRAKRSPACALRPPSPMRFRCTGWPWRSRPCEAAGAHADGLMLYLCSVDRYRRAVPRMRLGAEAVRRSPADVSVSLLIPTFIHDDLPIARQAAREFLVHYAGMPQYAKAFEASGFAGEMQGVRNGLATGDAAAAMSALSDRLLDEVLLVGPAARCREQLDASRAAGVEWAYAWPPASRRAGPFPPGPARHERTGAPN